MKYHLHICAYIYIYTESQEHQVILSAFSALYSRHGIECNDKAFKYFNSRENNNLYIKYSPSR